jgi:hypothetical protein
MIDSYWELYVAYIDKCVRDNWKNDIDPHHYEMEWNHFLPQCIFGDWPIGQWLTKPQHAVASALQTLSFKKNCMFGWHKHHLPSQLLDTAWIYFCKSSSETGLRHADKLAERNRVQNPTLGVPKSEQHRRKISEALKGKPRSKAHCESISKSKKGFRHTEESRQKMSKARTGLQKSEDHKMNIGLALKGKKHSDETKRKISESQKRRLALRKQNEQPTSNSN